MDVAAASTGEHEKLARSLTLSPNITFVNDTPDGNLQTLIGRFDVGLHREQLRDAAMVLDAVKGFVKNNSSLFFTAPPRDELAEWSLAGEPRVDGAVTFFDLNQTTQRVPWLDSTIVLQIDNESAQLISLSGDIRVSTFSPVSVQELTEAEAAEFVGLSAELERGAARFRRGIDPFTESLSWQFEYAGGSGLLDEESETVVLDVPSDGAVVYKNCTIAYRDLVRDGSGRVTDILVVNPTLYSATEKCEGDTHILDNNCDFKLRDMLHNQAIEQIDDHSDGPGANVSLDYIRNIPCSTAVPNFNSTSSNDAEQREAYVAMKQIARTAREKFFSQFAPQSNESVELNTDYDDTDAPAYYSDFWSEMYFDNGAVFPHVVWHEYGHHIANMYGNFSNTCTAFIDEGDSLDEAIGAASAATILATATTSTYGAARNLGVGHASVHATAANRRVYSANACLVTPHFAAQPFAQAYWEVLSNRNCDNIYCDVASTAFINTASSLIPGAAQVAFQDEVARSLAYALSASPANTTYGSLLSFMNSRWLVNWTPAQALAVRGVFTHHGI
jgi:hypothetical protein